MRAPHTVYVKTLYRRCDYHQRLPTNSYYIYNSCQPCGDDGSTIR